MDLHLNSTPIDKQTTELMKAKKDALKVLSSFLNRRMERNIYCLASIKYGFSNSISFLIFNTLHGVGSRNYLRFLVKTAKQLYRDKQ